MKRNESGVTMIALIVTIIVMIIIAGITFKFSKDLLKDSELKNDVTNMLLILAKAEVIYDKNQFDSENNPLVGTVITADLIGNRITNDLANAYSLTSEEEMKKWYIWDKNTQELIDLNIDITENEYYIVNYADGEVIYSEGYTDLENNRVYTLSEMKNISENI